MASRIQEGGGGMGSSGASRVVKKIANTKAVVKVASTVAKKVQAKAVKQNKKTVEKVAKMQEKTKAEKIAKNSVKVKPANSQGIPNSVFNKIQTSASKKIKSGENAKNRAREDASEIAYTKMMSNKKTSTVKINSKNK